MKRTPKLILSYLFCSITPWVATSVIYFAAQERWMGVFGCVLLTSALTALGLEGIMNPNHHHSPSTEKPKNVS